MKYDILYYSKNTISLQIYYIIIKPIMSRIYLLKAYNSIIINLSNNKIIYQYLYQSYL